MCVLPGPASGRSGPLLQGPHLYANHLWGPHPTDSRGSIKILHFLSLKLALRVSGERAGCPLQAHRTTSPAGASAGVKTRPQVQALHRCCVPGARLQGGGEGLRSCHLTPETKPSTCVRPERAVPSRERPARTLAVPARCQVRTAAPRGCHSVAWELARDRLLPLPRVQAQGQRPLEEGPGMAHSTSTCLTPFLSQPPGGGSLPVLLAPQETEGSREKGQFPKRRPRLQAGQHRIRV